MRWGDLRVCVVGDLLPEKGSDVGDALGDFVGGEDDVGDWLVPLDTTDRISFGRGALPHGKRRSSSMIYGDEISDNNPVIM